MNLKIIFISISLKVVQKMVKFQIFFDTMNILNGIFEDRNFFFQVSKFRDENIAKLLHGR